MEKWSLKESVEKHSKDPTLRANTELALQEMGDSKPAYVAYRRALLNNDVKTVDKFLTSRQIFRLREKAKTNRYTARYLEFLVQRLKKLENS